MKQLYIFLPDLKYFLFIFIDNFYFFTEFLFQIFSVRQKKRVSFKGF